MAPRTHPGIQIPPDDLVVHLFRIFEIRKLGFTRECKLLEPVEELVFLTQAEVRVLRCVL